MKPDILKKIKPKYVVLVLLIAAFILSYFAKFMSTEHFSSIDVSHGDIQFYGRDSCPFCVKMKDELKKDMSLYKKIEYIDIETEHGADKFKKVESSGVPHFECSSTGKQTSGFQSTDKLLENLGLIN